jgi:hypothetical protein
LEYWSIGVLEKAKTQSFNFETFLHDSITPPLHYSTRLAYEGKTPEAPSGGSSKPGPLGLGFLFLRTGFNNKPRLLDAFSTAAGTATRFGITFAATKKVFAIQASAGYQDQLFLLGTKGAGNMRKVSADLLF